jgi:hypothetical protein
MAQITTQTILPIVETIFEWDAKWPELNRQSRSHCLLRIFIDSEHERAAVIASELDSNRGNVGIGVDFEGLAKAVIRDFSSSLPVALPQVQWVQHYGIFSTPASYENLGTPDEFSQIDWNWKQDTIAGEQLETVMDASEFQERYSWIELAPVEKVLSKVK